MRLALTAVLALLATTSWADGLIYKRMPTAEEVRVVIYLIKENWLDPYSVRDAQISEVVGADDSFRQLCVKGNAKNSNGAYSGMKYHLVTMNPTREGNIYIADVDENGVKTCRALNWRAFPELSQ
jgi:predicted transcriptional regulator with HTH domain